MKFYLVNLILLISVNCQNQIDSTLKGNAFSSFFNSFLIIFINEIADKTFICVLLFSLKNNKFLTFVTSMLSLAIMSIITIIIGHFIPMLIYRSLFEWIAIILFLSLGIHSIYSSYKMKYETLEEEIEEEIEIIEKNKILNEPLLENEKKKVKKSLVETGYFAFILQMMFAEIGDKTQLDTIALSTIFDPFFVFFGAMLGYALCCLVAILTGTLFAKHLSEKTMTLISGIVFILFAVQIFYVKMTEI